MAAKELMNTTITSSLFFLLLLAPASGGVIETSAGVTPTNGVSPVPTEAPGLNGIPKELRKRDNPQSVCGMIDGNPNNLLSCPPYTPCYVTSNFYYICCTMPNPDLCFNAYTPITCLDYETYRQNPSAGSLTVKCTDSSLPYCLTLTTDGLSPQFGCASTSYPRIHSFLPIATSSVVLPNTFPATTIPPSRTPTPISNNDSNSGNKRKSRLPTSAKAGIGSAVGVVTLAVIAFLSFCFRRRRNRAHVSPTDGGAEPVMAQSNNTPKAAQPVQQQYRQQPQGYQEAVPVQQQFQPQPQSNQYANTKHPDPADSPSDLAPNYTSGSQHISSAFIPPNEPTSDPNIVRI